MAIVLNAHKTRIITFYDANDKCVPVFDSSSHLVDFTPKYPLPFNLNESTVIKKYADAYWIGSKKGLIRYCESEKNEFDKVMYFSAERDFKDNNILAIHGDENKVFVKTETAVSLIELRTLTCEEKAKMLMEETLGIVARHGMISNMYLHKPWDLSSKNRFTVSDNDGGFTASCCIGMMMNYALLRDSLGKDAKETQEARKIARRTLDACMLLMYIHGRGDGFVARTYITADYPKVHDGIYVKRCGDVATVIENNESIKRGLSGKSHKIVEKIPEDLKYLFEDDGYTEDDIIYKCDTSSDEITLHLVNLYYAYIIFGHEEPMLCQRIKKAAADIVKHILSHGNELFDFTGEPTSWARWSDRYFDSEIGWGDGPLNSNELLMYVKLACEICDEKDFFTEEYEKLVKKGYPALGKLHEHRAYTNSIFKHCETAEDIMYGDHMLANLTYFMLMLLEKDEELKKHYYEGWQSWRSTSIGMEHNPVYDIPFLAVCKPDEFIDEEALKMQFYRFSPSRFAGKTSLKLRADVPALEHRAGYLQSSRLVSYDEKFVSKYDRDMLWHHDGYDSEKCYVDTCSPFTLPYYMGKYYSIIEEAEHE